MGKLSLAPTAKNRRFPPPFEWGHSATAPRELKGAALGASCTSWRAGISRRRDCYNGSCYLNKYGGYYGNTTEN